MKKYVLNEKAKEFIREFYVEETAEQYIEAAEMIFSCGQQHASFNLAMGKGEDGHDTSSCIRLFLLRSECAIEIEE